MKLNPCSDGVCLMFKIIFGAKMELFGAETMEVTESVEQKARIIPSLICTLTDFQIIKVSFFHQISS